MTPPIPDAPDAGTKNPARLPLFTLIGFLVAVAAVVVIAWLSSNALAERSRTSNRVTQSFKVSAQFDAVASLVKDAETGQRGFVLTADERYLEPFTKAKASLAGEVQKLKDLVDGDVARQAQVDRLNELALAKFKELDETIALIRDGKRGEAMEIVTSDRGKLAMDALRRVSDEAGVAEDQQLALRKLDWEAAATRSAFVTWAGSALLLILICGAAFLASRDYQQRERQLWLRQSLAGLEARMRGDQPLDRLGENVLGYLAKQLDAQLGAMYLLEHGALRRFAGYALPPQTAPLQIEKGHGLVGQAAAEGRVLHVAEVPATYMPVTSALGHARPRALLVAPVHADGAVNGVVELGFLHAVHAADLELLELGTKAIGIALRSARDRSRLEELLAETQQQAEELQTQQEELRVSNEELEEQGRILKTSQARLESQHAELEQTNTQLEEQAQRLEEQQKALRASEGVLAERALELQRTNQYKSEFLANMSHELRTPLNSSLILAKLLADNKQGNLTDEQVKFAKTISTAGNDLLALINDILDLSKIEVGKIEVDPATVFVKTLVDGTVKMLEPIAAEKHLGFVTELGEGVPARIETDAQRVGQILRNLLSNALKFTEKGSVTLTVSAPSAATIAFSVTDTGIGIPADQQAVIFEAFRQADGSTQRKYGGTGLGLSISRDLARLLGGDIVVQSAAGKGSTFTLTLPRVYVPAAPSAQPQRLTAVAPAAPAPRPAQPAVTQRPITSALVEDDRDHLSPNARVILVIEDDVHFSTILRDLARERGFQCVVAHTANEGLAAALAFQPSAIVLDVKLPDHSGLGVLDQLKHNAATRHIPVHMASVSDYTREALEMGAVGFAIKPVKRDELIDAFRKLEAKSSQGLRRVLVVEDDATQREAIEKLLATDDVEIAGAATGKDALLKLKTTTFDCMVMDLTLPDLSGYELLEAMAQQDGVGFPPVIVYTGRVLTRDEEQRLRKFSRSIIIKDARSPERLLDEVTLFLHQVESALPPERQKLLKDARARDTMLEGRKILVVEDDVRNVFALSSVLEPLGAKVTIARNGKEALGVIDREGKDVDLVLMDIMMPEMDGLTATREIRQRPAFKKLPIIALTAKAMKDDQENCIAAGANDYIAKPLNVEKLLSLVRVWMPKT